MADEPLGRAVAVTALAPIAEQLAEEQERKESDEARRRQLDDELTALPPLERPTPPKAWVGEVWDPKRIVGAVVWTLGVASLWSALFVTAGTIVVAIFFNGTQVIQTLVEVLGIGAVIVIAAWEPAKMVGARTARRQRAADEKVTYERAVKAFDARETERSTIRAKCGADHG